MSGITYPPNFMQSAGALLQTDEKSDPNFKPLLDVGIEAEFSWFVCVWASAAFVVDGDTEVYLQLQLDGVPVVGGSVSLLKDQRGTLFLCVRLEKQTDGPHTLTLAWKAPAANAQCFPVTNPEQDFASLVAQVVTV